MKPVKLKDVIDYLEMADDNFKAYYSKKTGEILSVSVEDLSIAEESGEDEDFGEYPEWQGESIKKAINIIENWKDYIELPDRFEINEYGIMEDFCLSIRNERIQNDIYYSIKGKGAFRRFRDRINHYGLEQEWYSYRYNALRKIAIDWCEGKGIIYFQ
ncbi:MAG: hypothetical protein K6T80_00375 [Firmicutes bacterium]|nr:hypothetical protein [Bacillota bacterium]